MPLIMWETIGDNWKSNIGPSINPIPSTAFTAGIDPATDMLLVTNQADKDMAGGLVSEQIPLPQGYSLKYFGLDVIFWLTAENLAQFARGENDLKITFPGGAQANVSTEWNDDTKSWQLDPTGKKWVNANYPVPPRVGRNKWQVRAYFTGTVWGVTGLWFNQSGDSPFTPDPNVFTNLPAISTNWAAGLHPQLQTECRKAPFFLREEYERVRVLASDTPIPFLFD